MKLGDPEARSMGVIRRRVLRLPERHRQMLIPPKILAHGSTGRPWVDRSPDEPRPHAPPLVPCLGRSGNPLARIRSVILGAVCGLGPLSGAGLAQCLNWGAEFAFGPNFEVEALQSFDDGSGPALFVAWPGGVLKWTPGGWLGTAALDDAASALGVHAGTLYAGGWFTGGIARWTGSAWVVPGGGLSSAPFPYTTPIVYSILSFDEGSGPRLFVGGVFNGAGAVSSKGIIRWNGTSWSSVGGGLNNMPDGIPGVRAMAVYDDGTGPALYVAGGFTHAGTVLVNHIAKWNGTSWSALGSGTNNGVFALAVFDDGTGPQLYAGGYMNSAGGVPLTSYIARWNGMAWAAVPGTFSNVVESLTVYDDGNGPALYAGGYYGYVNGALYRRIARWDGTLWSALGSGVHPGGTVGCMAVHDDGSGRGPDLYLGGMFTHVGGELPSSMVARWHGCRDPIEPMCFGDRTVAPCPCQNYGWTGHGCENSTSTGGARLFAQGTINPDTIVLTSAGELPSALSIFIQGSELATLTVPFGDGIRCVGGSLKRLYVKSATNSTAQAPQPGDPSITQQSANLGEPIPPGAVRYYQVYYRDPDAGFCAAPTGSTFNASNGLRIVWTQ